MAEAVFLDLLKSKGKLSEWDVDSAATAGYHVGDSPEPRCFKVLQSNGVKNYEHVVRQVNIYIFILSFNSLISFVFIIQKLRIIY